MVFKLILNRLIMTIPTLVLLSIVVFSIVKLIPGDPAMVLLGEKSNAASYNKLKKEMGLDKPAIEQYFGFMKKVLVDGDFGRSLYSGDSIRKTIGEKFPATFELALCALLFAILIGLPSGIISAIWPGTIVDFASVSTAIVGVSIPVFWLALMLTSYFGLELGWFPISQRLGVEYYYEAKTGFVLIDSLVDGNFEMFKNALHHLVLPAVTLGTIPMAFIARMTRSSLLEVIKDDYIRTAEAKGVSKFNIYNKHALKNALIPVLTVLGLQFGLLLGGAIITETVFSWPGIGSWLLDSVNSRDYPAIEIGVLFIATSFVLINLLVDVLYVFVDPRVRVG